MTKTVQHISLKKSAIPGKVPAKNVLAYGELAVNYGEGGEKIFLQNTANNIVEFSSDGLLDKKYLSTTSGGTVSGDTEFKGDVKIVYPDSTSQTVSLREVIVDNEEVTSAALNELNERISDQKTDIDTIKAKECLPLSGGTVSGDTEFKGDVKIVYPDSTSQTVSLREVIVDNEEVTSAALNELNERISDQKTDIDTIKAKECLPLSGGTVSGETTFNKDVKVVFPNSETPTSLVSAIVDNEKVTAAALNDLNEKFDNYLPFSGGTLNGQLTVHELYIYDTNGVKYKFDVASLLNHGHITQV